MVSTLDFSSTSEALRKFLLTLDIFIHILRYATEAPKSDRDI